MDINSVGSIYSNVNGKNSKSLVSHENTKKISKETKLDIKATSELNKYVEQEFGFIGADEKFIDSFSRLTTRMHTMATGFLKNKIDVALVMYNEEKITQELKQKLGQDFELTQDLKQKIYSQAKELSEQDGFYGVNLGRFLSYIVATPKLLQNNDDVFFNALEKMYSSERLNEIA